MNQIIIYGDGACSGNPGPGGWGAVLYNPGKASIAELGGHEPRSTNNKMELTALIESLNFLHKSQIPPSQVQAYWDSSYVVNGYSKWIYGWQKKGFKKSDGQQVLNLDLWQEIWRLIKDYGKITIERVDGHSGIPANERCDEIAVAFSKKQSPDLFKGSIENYTALSANDFVPNNDGQKFPVYLSKVDGQVQEHKTWAECQSRVKGTSGAAFKKVKNASEKAATLSKWN